MSHFSFQSQTSSTLPADENIKTQELHRLNELNVLCLSFFFFFSSSEKELFTQTQKNQTYTGINLYNRLKQGIRLVAPPPPFPIHTHSHKQDKQQRH